MADDPPFLDPIQPERRASRLDDFALPSQEWIWTNEWNIVRTPKPPPSPTSLRRTESPTLKPPPDDAAADGVSTTSGFTESSRYTDEVCCT